MYVYTKMYVEPIFCSDSCALELSSDSSTLSFAKTNQIYIYTYTYEYICI